MESRGYLVEDLLGALNPVEKKNAPDTLYVSGDTEILAQGARVSVVGSRRASEAGLAAARDLSERLARKGVVIVSGLAEGVDTQAHWAAIREKGRTIAVLGTPLDIAYPASNRALQDLIMREHLAVSQFKMGTSSHRSHFPMRNRTMALVADATVIVQAGENSGSLHQGWEALRLGRPLFLLESVVGNPDLQWPREMMRYGAVSLSLDCLDVIYDYLPERTGEEAPPLAL